jgi:peptide chain release factor 3
MGYDFQGIYNLWEQDINLFSGETSRETIAFLDAKSELEKGGQKKPADKLRR